MLDPIKAYYMSTKKSENIACFIWNIILREESKIRWATYPASELFPQSRGSSIPGTV